jgi:two-component system, OmpR family, phosphate regulon response regulator PhoB
LRREVVDANGELREVSATTSRRALHGRRILAGSSHGRHERHVPFARVSRLLMIASDDESSASMQRYLEAAGHVVVAVRTPADAVRRARAERAELVVVDDELREGSAAEVCRAVKWGPEGRHLPIVILGRRNDPVDRVVALELGAEDYLVKPISMRELVLRVRALLRRAPPARPTVVEVGTLRIDAAAHKVWVEGGECGLTVLELRLLCMLYDARPRVVERATLHREVWAGMEAPGRALDTCVKRLRRKLGNAGHYIETVRGTGYRFRVEAE